MSRDVVRAKKSDVHGMPLYAARALRRRPGPQANDKVEPATEEEQRRLRCLVLLPSDSSHGQLGRVVRDVLCTHRVEIISFEERVFGGGLDLIHFRR